MAGEKLSSELGIVEDDVGLMEVLEAGARTQVAAESALELARAQGLGKLRESWFSATEDERLGSL